MASLFSFQCSCCGAIHEGAPGFSFDAPWPYRSQRQEVRESGHLGTDTCWYTDEDGTHYFIRVCLEIPILGFDEPIIWGVWVSLSLQSFQRYLAIDHGADIQQSYFGWFCNRLPYYPETIGLKTQVHPRVGGIRPSICLEEIDHPLAMDFHRGISMERAQEIAESLLHR